MVARFGGEEFAILLPNTDRLGISALAERVRAAIEALGIEHSGSSVSRQVTISVGGASFLAVDGAGAQDLVRWADAALYRAKSGGRNQTATHGSETLLPRLLAVA